MQVWLWPLVIILILLAVLGMPTWGTGYGSRYGWAPSGGLGLIVVILIVLLLVGRL
jgi:sterol desaturase/sphingolipid hydroxylase (fatty acid hydroxylase superfamily)